jgi:abhydrolase domain-containing protein 1/3
LIFEATFGNLYHYDFLCEKLHYKREIVQHPDGGILAIDWAGPKAKKSKKIMLVAPGISGDSTEQYIRHLGHDAIAKGYTIGVLTGRGISGLPLKTPLVHNACSYNDFGFLIKRVKKRYPKVFLTALGISMGSGILLKYVVESGDRCELDAISNIATSFNHHLTLRTIEEFWPHFGIPSFGILKVLQNSIKRIEHHLMEWPEVLDQRDVCLKTGKNAKRIYDIDDKVISRLSGFLNAEEYYQDGSTHDLIDKVKIPLFALNSLDDPVVTAKGIPYESFRTHEKTILMTTSCGGHVGWFTGFIKVKRWFQVPCLEFFEAIRTHSHRNDWLTN